MVQLTYYPAQRSERPGELKWGYRPQALDRLTRVALATHYYGRGVTSAADRYHAAWSGIAVALYEATARPTENDLVHAGLTAITDLTNAETKAHGWVHEGGTTRYRPSVAVYWHAPGDGWEDALVERLALRPAMERLTRAQREAVLAVYALGSYAAAEKHLRITRAALTYRLHAARVTILGLWMEGETPIPPRYVHDRAPIEHGTPHGARAHRKRREKPCEECRLADRQGVAA